MKRYLPILLALAMLLSGCRSGDTPTTPDSTTPHSTSPTVSNSDYFTDRDFRTEYDGNAAHIQLSGGSASCDSDAVQISGSTITITDEGTYILSGTLDDGMVIVDTDKANKVQLVLSGADITSATSAPIYIRQADKVFITLAAGTESALRNGGSFEAIDENNIDAVIFSKEDLTLNGSGSVTIESPAGHGVVSKDELTVTGGSYTITTASHSLDGKDNICIAGGTFTIAAGKDGLHAENDEDTALGFVYISGGSFTVSAEGDGITAGAWMTMDGGTFDLTTGGGSVNGQQQSSNNWGGFGGMGGPGGMGGRPGDGGSGGTESATDADSTSMKGLKAAGDLTVNAGSFTIDSADDSVHSDTNVTVSGGTFHISSGDDGFHAEDTLTFHSGAVTVTESYEALEGLHILVAGGTFDLVSTDDGLNAAGGTDQSGMGGRDQMFGGPGGFGGMSAGNGSIVISGGDLYVNASGDGIDANGTLEITGGYTVVVGPTMGDTATLDYDTSAVISGGTFIGTGSSMMAQVFSDVQNQGLIAVNVGSAPAGTELTLTDADGSVVIAYTPELSYNVVILCSPDIVKGESYTITVGTASGTFEAS